MQLFLGEVQIKFKNNRSYPIKVLCTNSNGTITTTIFGLKEENDYQVEIEAYVTSYIPYKTITKPTSSLKVGQTKVIESGSNGCNTVSYKNIKTKMVKLFPKHCFHKIHIILIIE